MRAHSRPGPDPLFPCAPSSPLQATASAPLPLDAPAHDLLVPSFAFDDHLADGFGLPDMPAEDWAAFQPQARTLLPARLPRAVCVLLSCAL